MNAGVLLDTHTALWLDAGAPLAEAARHAIEEATAQGAVYVSTISAWEIGLLAARRRLVLDRHPALWFSRFVAGPGVRVVPLSAEAAIASSFLPGTFHPDPADRILVATARVLDVPIVTRDHRILEYARTGSVAAIAC